jgi:hypothetical protein
MVTIASQLDYPQLPDSYIRVKDCTEGFMKYLVGAAEVLWANPGLYESSAIHVCLASAPAKYSSLVVHPSTPLNRAAQLTITQILTSQLPDIPAADLLAMFELGGDGKSELPQLFKSLKQQDDTLDTSQLSELEPLRRETLQWLHTRHHFPIRPTAQPYEMKKLGPQVVWALVWLHHHVLGALRAWGEGRLTTRQLADIFEAAGRCTLLPLP